MDNATIGKLSEVNDALVEHLRWLLEKRDLDAASKLIPVVDKLTNALIEIHENKSR